MFPVYRTSRFCSLIVPRKGYFQQWHTHTHKNALYCEIHFNRKTIHRQDPYLHCATRARKAFADGIKSSNYTFHPSHGELYSASPMTDFRAFMAHRPPSLFPAFASPRPVFQLPGRNEEINPIASPSPSTAAHTLRAPPFPPALYAGRIPPRTGAPPRSKTHSHK